MLTKMMNQEFKATAPHHMAGTDVTIFPLDGQIVFLSPIIYFHICEVIAYFVRLDAKTNKMIAKLYILKKQHDRAI